MIPRPFNPLDVPVSRRAASTLALGTLALTAPAMPAIAATSTFAADGFAPPAGQVEVRPIVFADPVEKLKAEFRIFRDLADEADVLLWYFFTVFIVAEGRKVAPFVRYEGIEFSHHRRIAEHTYRVHGHNMSFPRDLETGAFIDSAVNPITGKTVKVPPTVLTEDPGMIYAPAGKRPLDRKEATFTPTQNQFRIEDSIVKVEQIRVPPDTWPTPFIETSHNWTPRALFEDASVKRLPMGTSGGYISPFPRWLEMGDTKGHTFAIWSGKKLDGAHQLPAEYTARAKADYPDLLRVDLSKFDKPA
ncbi:MAG: hypothetical protein SFV21_20765 [Rhodospirillaceae bacterium]|nr:hypothetical protein [Rhodospirillaceae bacterium]